MIRDTGYGFSRNPCRFASIELIYTDDWYYEATATNCSFGCFTFHASLQNDSNWIVQ